MEYRNLSSDSYFDGGLIELVIIKLVGGVIAFVTLGICLPWALCLQYRFYIDHTVVEGRRLRFTGSAISLFAQWIKWFFLILITLGIYSFWVGIALEKWKVQHTEFAN